MARKKATSVAEGKRTGFGANGAKSAYDSLSADRLNYTQRAEQNAALTIPALFPKQGDNGSTKYAQPWQSVGARGINTLAAKLMLALFPQQTWMKLQMSEWLMKQAVDDDELREKAQQSFSMIERILMDFMQSNCYSTTLFDCIKQLIVAGNALLFCPEPQGTYTPMKLYRLNSYVVQRDAYGNVLQIITVDRLAFSSLPEDVRNALTKGGKSYKPDELIELYTHIYLDETSTETFQKYEEVDGMEIPGTAATYPANAVPYLPVRMIRQDGEAYGRSYVEEFYGDLNSLENLTKAIVGQAMIASKVIGLVNPGGITQPRRLTNAQSGDFVPGKPEDVQFLQLGKGADFTIAQNVSTAIEQRLAFAFLLNSAVQRNAERVSATEIRIVAQELQDTLGGIYSVLSQELQLKLINVLLSQLQATKKIPELPKEAITPTVVVGMEALGRGQDKDKLTEFMQGLSLVGNAAANPDINKNTLTLRWANSVGIDVDGIILTDEEKAKQVAMDSIGTGMDAGAQSLGANGGMAAMSSPDAMQNAMDNAGVQMAPVGQP